jgi:hypothetical protein
MNGSGDFERDLGRELHRILDPIATVPIPPRRTPAPRGTGVNRRLLGGAGAALGVKVLTGFAVAAFAAAAAGAATEVAVTGSLNPTDWGPQVHQTVQTCKDQLRASGTRGIGACVSAIASQHGQQAGDGSKSTKGNDKADGTSNGKDIGKGNGNGNGKDNGKGSANGNGNGNGSGHGNGNGNGGNGGNADGNATNAEPIDSSQHPGPSPVPGD